MHWPSGLKVRPAGTTSPTTGFDTPTFSSLRINCGMTDSDELVPSTVKISSLMYFRNFSKLNPQARQMAPRTISTNNAQVPYMVATSLPSEAMEPNPYLPTVKDIAPNAATGAKRMIMPTIANMALANESSAATNGLPRSPRWARATPMNTENT